MPTPLYWGICLNSGLWRRRPQPAPPRGGRCLPRPWSKQNVPVYFIHGNRDFLLGRQFARQAGMTCSATLRVIELYGERGAEPRRSALHPGWGYQKFRRITQCRNGCAGSSCACRWHADRPSPTRCAGQSQMENAHKSQTIMDVTPEAVDDAPARLLPDDPRPHPQARHPRLPLDGRPATHRAGRLVRAGLGAGCAPAGSGSETRTWAGGPCLPWSRASLIRPFLTHAVLWQDTSWDPCIYSGSLHTARR